MCEQMFSLQRSSTSEVEDTSSARYEQQGEQPGCSYSTNAIRISLIDTLPKV